MPNTKAVTTLINLVPSEDRVYAVKLINSIIADENHKGWKQGFQACSEIWSPVRKRKRGGAKS